MWAVMLFTAGGEQYEYSVIPSSDNPTVDEIVMLALQAHMLNCLTGIVTVCMDGSSRLTEAMVIGSYTRFPALPFAG